jgi:serine protease Do
VRYALIAAVLLSCAVTQEVIITPQERVTQELENKNYLQVVEILGIQQQTESDDYIFARDALIASLEDEELDDDSFWRISTSLEKIGQLERSGLDSTREVGTHLLEQGYWPALLSFLKTESERKTIDWDYWREKLSSDDRFRDLPYLESFFDRRSISQTIGLDNLLDATVTVFVDKGIQLENGISYPDNVIGSGFFIDRQGHLLTNYHVIQSEVDPEYEGFSRAYIRLRENNGQKIPVKVLGWDPEFDLALVKAPVDSDSYIPLSYWSRASLGDTVKALGSPLGLEATITSGVVSNVERSNFNTGFRLQVDVPVNPGNSGGPLVNTLGESVGVIFAGVQPFHGLNFAIPTDYVHRLLPRLYQGQKIEHFRLGIQIIKDDQDFVINYVEPRSPADYAGIAVGDILKSIDGKSILRLEDAQHALLDNTWGSLTEVVWEREGEVFSAFILPDKKASYPWREALDCDDFGNLFGPLLGVRLERIGHPAEMNFRVQKVFPGSLGEQYSFSKNDPVKVLGTERDPSGRL